MRFNLFPFIRLLFSLILILQGCNKENVDKQFNPPVIILLNGPEASIDRGISFTLELKLVADAGIDQLTINGQSAIGVIRGEAEQTLEIILETSKYPMRSS